MKFIEFHRHLCDDCYKCLRTCPTKAIAFIGDKRHVINEMCVKCGRCQEACPHKALKIQNDIGKVRQAISTGQRVAVSLAPSFISAFPLKSAGQMAAGLRRLGFSIVEETAEGAELVSREYEVEIEKEERDNIITTCCPSATYLIEQHYPEYLDLMIPVVSPMIAHGRILKKRYSDVCYTVFIGPCLAKKAEAEELTGAIDAVLTFNELENWFINEGIALNTLEPQDFDNQCYQRGRAYPLGSSTRKTNLEPRLDNVYKFMRVEGVERCRELLASIEKGSIHRTCIEMNICSGSCINGPDFPKESGNFYDREITLYNYAMASPTAEKNSQFHPLDTAAPSLERNFKDKAFHAPLPSDGQLEKILQAMGKFSLKDQLNCGACGYGSCLEKAAAVFHNISDIHMCLPYLRARAENMRSVIFEHTPNLLMLLDMDLNILEVNPAFNKVFNTEHRPLKGFPVYAFMNETLFRTVAETGDDLIAHKEHFKDLNREFYVTIVQIPMENILLATMTDVTIHEKNRQELLRIKEQTVRSCQDVIQKQMRVAQEIASLLGETTAETKVNLNRLKELVLNEDGGQQ